MLADPTCRLLLLLVSLLALAAAKPSSQHRLRHSRHQHHRRRPQADAPAVVAEPPGSRPANTTVLEGFVASNCTSCLAREEAKWARIEKIKRDLLEKLGFGSRQPSANASADLPSLNAGPIHDVIRRFGLQSDAPDQPYRIDLEAQDTSAKTERVYSFARPVPAELRIRNPDGIGMAYFAFSESTRESEVTEAVLNIYIQPPSSLSDETPSTLDIKLQLFRITKKGQMEETAFKTKKVEVNPRFGKWVKIGVAAQAQQWFDKPDRNFGLHVRALYEGENLAVHPNDELPSKNMYVDILTVEGDKAGRSRRNAPPETCAEGGTEKRCCRYPLVIDFEEMGWDWVIAPKKYHAYYCNGGCPFKHLQSYIHTHVVSQRGLPEGATGPCCYPTELAPIMMVYMNDQMEVLVSKVPSMVASRCGCA